MKLKEYLEQTQIRPSAFARIAGVTAPTIYNVIAGKEISLSTALRIENATRRKVKCRDLLPSVSKTKPKTMPGSYKPRSCKPNDKAQKHEQHQDNAECEEKPLSIVRVQLGTYNVDELGI